MSIVITGTVKNGVVVPSVPLPEGACVEVHVRETPVQFTPELQEEFDAWDRASAGSIELIEHLAQEAEANEKR